MERKEEAKDEADIGEPIGDNEDDFVIRKRSQVQQVYANLRLNSWTVAAASLVAVPQRLVGLVTYVSKAPEADLWSTLAICYFVFIGLGLTFCVAQAILIWVHAITIYSLESKDMARLETHGEFPRHQLSYNNLMYRGVYWSQVLLIGVYSAMFTVSDSVIANQAAS